MKNLYKAPSSSSSLKRHTANKQGSPDWSQWAVEAVKVLSIPQIFLCFEDEQGLNHWRTWKIYFAILRCSTFYIAWQEECYWIVAETVVK